MSARDVMTPGLITCRPEARLREVAETLVSSHIHALVVTDSEGGLLGIVADSDLLAGEWLAEDEESLVTMRALTAGELMSAPVVTIAAEAAYSAIEYSVKASSSIWRKMAMKMGIAATSSRRIESMTTSTWETISWTLIRRR